MGPQRIRAPDGKGLGYAPSRWRPMIPKSLHRSEHHKFLEALRRLPEDHLAYFVSDLIDQLDVGDHEGV